MTYNTRSAKNTETSEQGTFRTIQQEVLGNKECTDDKIDKLQEAIEMLVTSMQGMMSLKPVQLEEFLEEEEEAQVVSKNKGVFRNPTHAALERKKVGHPQHVHKIVELDSDELDGRIDRNDSQSLKHLKLSFPVYKEGTDTEEWLRDCEEYFTIFEVSDKRRAPIAAKHLVGTTRS